MVLRDLLPRPRLTAGDSCRVTGLGVPEHFGKLCSWLREDSRTSRECDGCWVLVISVRSAGRRSESGRQALAVSTGST